MFVVEDDPMQLPDDDQQLNSHSNSEKSDNDFDDETEGNTCNVGWADSIAKILKTNKPKGKKALVLSKAKKITDVNNKKFVQPSYEIDSKEGNLIPKSEESKDKESGPIVRSKRKKELPTFRVKPNIVGKNHEKVLAKIATKGVVQLFNAVKMQQKDIDKKLKEAGPLEVKRDKVLKNIDRHAFLDVLTQGKLQSARETVPKRSDTHLQKHKNNENDKPTWNVLVNDFMVGAKLKDWDKKLDEDSETDV